MFHVILLSLLVSHAIEAYISIHTRSLLMVSDHELFERSTELMDTPVTVLSTNQTIKGVSINIHTNTLYIIDSSSSILELRDNKIKNLITIERHLLQNIKIDWVNNILYILMATTNLDTINYSVKMLNLKENTLEDLFLFRSKPLQIEVDPCKGFLFWSTQIGLYRLDLHKKRNDLNIEKTNILIFKKENIGPFLIDHLKSQLLVLLSKDNTIISVSFDGKDVIDIRNNTQEAIFNEAITLSYVNELFYWSNGIILMGEDYYISDQKYYHTVFPSNGFKINLLISKDINQQPFPKNQQSTTGFGGWNHKASNHNLWDEYNKSEQPGITILILILSFGFILMLFLLARPIFTVFYCCAKKPDVLVDLKEIVQRPTFILTNNPNYQRAMVFKKSDNNELIRIKRNQITITKRLGSGAFGEVFEGNVKDLINGKPEYRVALKSLKESATGYESNEFLKEAKLMNNLKHKNILQVLGVCLDNKPIFIIMELMEGGDLLSFLRKSRMQVYNCINYMRMCIDVAEGCSYLEEMQLVHRDIASRNCLVSFSGPNDLIIKIGDFGLARDIYAHDYYHKDGKTLLPVRWMSPESLVDGIFTCKSDVWAFGVLLWEVMSQGQQPYPGLTNINAMYFVQNGGRLEKPINCPNTLYKLMNKCWHGKPEERPSFKFCLKFIKLYYTVFEYINQETSREEKSVPIYLNL